MSFTSLPSNCNQLIIFHLNYPLQKLLPLRLVSHRFKSAIETQTSTQTSLKLFGSLESVKLYAFKTAHLQLSHYKLNNDDLIFNHQNLKYDQLCDFLLKIFPNLSSLVIVLEESVRFYKLPYLIENWKRLTHLSLFGAVNSYLQEDYFWGKLAIILDLKLPNLKVLDLKVKGLYCYQDFRSGMSEIVMRRRMRQLESFGLAFYPGDLAWVTSQLGAKCEQLELGEDLEFGDSNDLYLAMSAVTLLRNLSHLIISNQKILFDLTSLPELPNISKLTIVNPNLDSFKSFPKLIYKIFPNLEKLKIQSNQPKPEKFKNLEFGKIKAEWTELGAGNLGRHAKLNQMVKNQDQVQVEKTSGFLLEQKKSLKNSDSKLRIL